MSTLYLTEEYSLVRRETENMLLVEVPARETKDGVRGTPAYSKRIPLIKIDEVIVLGEITMTASALHLLLEREIEITFLGRYGQFKGRLSPPFSKNAVLRMAQYRAHQDMSKRCELARRFVIGKLMNQRTLLQRLNRRQSDAAMYQAIEQMDASRTGSGETAAEFSGELGPGARHKRGGFLVANVDEAHFVLLLTKGFHDPVDAVARQSKNRIDAPLIDGVDENFRGVLCHVLLLNWVVVQ